MAKQNIVNLTVEELRQQLIEWNEKPFHAGQIMQWIYEKGAKDFSSMSDISASLRKKLQSSYDLFDIQVAQERRSSDGTQKLLLTLADGNMIEAVNIPTQNRITGCVSTQVGCKFACSFCASGMLGFKRNLMPAEIIEQVILLQEYAKQRLNNLVFMGIGEPLDNYDNVLKAARIINAPWSMNIGARKITISTSGHIPGIKRLMEEGLQIELSVSLHGADEATRSKLMPINSVYPLALLMKTLKEYIKKTNRQVTFEYIMIRGVNTSAGHAQNLCALLKNMDAKINLIPCNPLLELGYIPPGKLEILFFKDYLVKHGVRATLRMPRGRDIDAACGQLRLATAKKTLS